MMKGWRSRAVLIIGRVQEDRMTGSREECDEHAYLFSARTRQRRTRLPWINKKVNPITLDPGYSIWSFAEASFRSPHSKLRLVMPHIYPSIGI